MPDPAETNSNQSPADYDPDNSAQRNTAINNDPEILLEQARNANEGKGPNSSGSMASSTAEDYVPSTSDPEPSDLPSSR